MGRRPSCQQRQHQNSAFDLNIATSSSKLNSLEWYSLLFFVASCLRVRFFLKLRGSDLLAPLSKTRSNTGVLKNRARHLSPSDL